GVGLPSFSGALSHLTLPHELPDPSTLPQCFPLPGGGSLSGNWISMERTRAQEAGLIPPPYSDDGQDGDGEREDDEDREVLVYVADSRLMRGAFSNIRPGSPMSPTPGCMSRASNTDAESQDEEIIQLVSPRGGHCRTFSGRFISQSPLSMGGEVETFRGHKKTMSTIEASPVRSMNPVCDTRYARSPESNFSTEMPSHTIILGSGSD
ncbi:hypothetical protein KIPB_005991, partial [Kipferlia bialata]